MVEPDMQFLWETETKPIPEGPPPDLPRFCYAPPAAQVWPTKISHSSLPWRATVYLAGLDVVISPWCTWAKVTHVINCMGSKTQEGAPCRLWEIARNAELETAFYHSWVYNFVPNWNARFRFFDMVSLWLRDPRNVVVFHCKNGIDHAPFILFLIMVFAFKVKSSDAIEILAQHRGADCRPLAGIERNRFFSQI